jgi:hypothetical protein
MRRAGQKELLFWIIRHGPIQTSRKTAQSSGRGKSSKKNFDFLAGALSVPNPPEGESKFFSFFFFKKRTAF